MTVLAAPTAEPPGAPTFGAPATWYRQRQWQIAGAVVAALVVAQLLLGGTTTFPEDRYIHLADPVNDFKSWVQRNRNDNVVIAHVLRPIGDFVLWLYEGLVDILVDLPWFWLPLAVLLVVGRSGRWVSAATAAGGLVYLELAGLHQRGMETISLMLICVLLCIAIGGPLGIWAGLNPKVERFLRPVLDALQSLPTTLYLVLAVTFFGIRQTPAAIATVAFGVPPMIRITAVGIRNVPAASVEAGRIFGSNRWQLLWKVQAPQAVRSFMTAINQTIMMCLGMAVIGGLIGAGGLGGELIQTLKLRSPGRGFVIGFGIFAIAYAFDRLSRSLMQARPLGGISARVWWGGSVAVLAVAYLVGRSIDSGAVPWVFDSDIAEPIDDFITWIRDHFGDALRSFSDFVVRDIVIRIQRFFGETIAWPVLIAAVAALGWFLRSWKFAIFCVIGLYAIGALGMWTWGLVTLSQILVAVIVGALIALPIGVFIGRRPRVEAVVEPLLDALQTIPSLIYAIPFVMLFGVGYVPSILATMLYAIPAGMRLAALAVKEVAPETLEAATTFGATNRQRLWGVHLPLAMRGLVLSVNQLIMMSISMAIVAGQIGENGLGYKSIEALTKPDIGLGVEAGLALLVMAIVLDRLSEGLADRFDPAKVAGSAH